jgi:small subunit ribosomal protein S2
MVDTNSDPSDIDFVIPANDDASKSISLIVGILCQAIEEGLGERKLEKDKEPVQKDKKSRKDLENIPASIIEAIVAEDEEEEEAEAEEEVVEADEELTEDEEEAI